MIGGALIERMRLHGANAAALTYGAVIFGLLLTVVFQLVQIVEGYRLYQESADALAQLEVREQQSPATEATAGSWPPGAPFLEGQTATVANATLLQQVTSAITRAGGTVVATEVEAQAAQSKTNYLKIVATCEIDQLALLRMLHDIEAGMPFLFVDQLLVQSPTSGNESGGRLRVRLGVSGMWPGPT